MASAQLIVEHQVDPLIVPGVPSVRHPAEV